MKKRPGTEDNFGKTAITFILGVIMGFSLLLMGLVFLMISLLALNSEESELPGYVWVLLGISSLLIGYFMMRRFLRSSPLPGTYK